MNRMIAVCDILGFSKLVKKRNLNDIVCKHLTYLGEALYFAIFHEKPPNDPPTLEELRQQNRVGFAWFSDTVILYSLGDDAESCGRVVETAAWLLFFTMFYSPTRIRLGISYGELYIDEINGIYVGEALVEAYEMEKSQEWAGGVLTESAVQHLESVDPESNLACRYYLIDYPVPFKLSNMSLKRNLTINWTRGGHIIEKIMWSENSDMPSIEDEKECRDVVRKFRNTIAFHKEICTFCRGK